MTEKQHKIVMFWGDEKQPAEYHFDTEAEMRAFLLGVSECDGWMSHHGADFDDTFVVEENTVCDGWINNWHDEHGEAQTFPNYLAACEALDEFFGDIEEAVREGNITTNYDPEDYRIVPIDIAN